MKSENEFIAGVYEKYERELEKRRKRTRFISTCTALSVCACAVIAVSIRTLPQLLNDSIAENETAVQSYDDCNDSSDAKSELAAMPAHETQGMMTKSAGGALNDGAENGVAEQALEGDADAAGDVANDVMLYSMASAAYSMRGDETAQIGTARRVTCSSGSFEYMLPTASDGSGLREFTDPRDEYYVEDEIYVGTGAVCGECESESAYLVSLEENGETLVLLLDKSVYMIDDAMFIANTLCYTAEREE